jgi:hypothetical protein
MQYAPPVLHRRALRNVEPFDITARLPTRSTFAIATPAAMEAGARHLLKRGYR